MRNLSNYINNLEFEYAVSYSGLRGKEFERLENENESRIEVIEDEIRKANLLEKPKLKEELRILSNEINTFNARIVNKNGDFHKSTKLIHRFEKEDREINQIFEILNTEFKEQIMWMCAQIYRDAIVFYSKENEVTGILQICFSCEWIKNEKEEDLEVDGKIFSKLKNILISLGHKIEDE